MTRETGNSYDVIIIGAGPAGIFSGLSWLGEARKRSVSPLSRKALTLTRGYARLLKGNRHAGGAIPAALYRDGVEQARSVTEN